MKVSELVEHHSIKIDAAHSVIVVRAIKTDAPTVGKINTEFALIGLRPRNRRREPLEVEPRHVLGLGLERRDVGEPRLWQLAAERRINQVHDTSDGLTGSNVGDHTCPALRSKVQRGKL